MINQHHDEYLARKIASEFLHTKQRAVLEDIRLLRQQTNFTTERITAYCRGIYKMQAGGVGISIPESIEIAQRLAILQNDKESTEQR